MKRFTTTFTNLQQLGRECFASPRPRAPVAHQIEPESLVVNRMTTAEDLVSVASLAVVHYIQKSTAQTAIGVGLGPCPMVVIRRIDMLPC